MPDQIPLDDEMTEGELWAGHKEARRAKRWRNRDQSLALLRLKGIEYQCLNEAVAHYRIGEYDFWPTTGKFMHRRSGKTGRGVHNLVKLLSPTK